jgi:hypothetical protein
MLYKKQLGYIILIEFKKKNSYGPQSRNQSFPFQHRKLQSSTLTHYLYVFKILINYTHTDDICSYL